MEKSLLAIRLKYLRESHKFTQQQVGTYLNISKQGYAHYENGTRVPDIYMLNQLATLYGIALDIMLSPTATEEALSGIVAEEAPEEQAPAPQKQRELSRREETLLQLFSELSADEKEDFLDLISIKCHRAKLRKNANTSENDAE